MPRRSSPRNKARVFWSAPGRALRLALRAHRREPLTLIFGALTLALGFGAAAANFSVLAGFTRPLPVPDGGDLQRVEVTAPSGGRAGLDLTEARLLAAEPVFAAASVFTELEAKLAAPDRPPLRVGVASVEPDLFETLRVQPLKGRVPRIDAEETVMIGEELWRGWLDADPGVIGRVVELDGAPREIAAVMPSPIRFPTSQQVWTMLDPSSGTAGAGGIVGRLAPGVRPGAASSRLETVLRASREREPAADRARLRVLGFTEERGEGGEVRGLTALLLIVVALLLVSSSNVSTLLLLRGQARARALSVHRALGARSGEIVLQVLAESLVIAAVGAIGGLGLAWGLAELLESRLQSHWGYPWMDVRLQPSVLLLLGALALVTAAVAGTLPAVRAVRSSLWEPLKQEASAHRSGGARTTWAALSVQVALCSIALTAALLLAVGLTGYRQVDEQVDARSIVLTGVHLDGPSYKDRQGRSGFWQRALRELERSPELEAGAVSSGTPILPGAAPRLRVEGAVGDAPAERPRAPVLYTSGGLFELYGLEPSAGELFDDAQVREALPIAVVSEGFVARHLAGREAVGRRIAFGDRDRDGDWRRIVGVVPDLILVSADRRRERPMVYLPLSLGDPAELTLSARSASEGGVRALEAMVHRIDREVPLVPSMNRQTVTTLDSLLSYVLRLYRVAAGLAMLAGAGAALVVVIGLYGVLAFEVQQRRAELGIRQALGADRARVLRLVLGRALWRLAPGLAVGLTLAWFVSPLFGVLLTGIGPHDPRIFCALIGLYGVMALVAAAGPGRRAASADPVEVLRSD